MESVVDRDFRRSLLVVVCRTVVSMVKQHLRIKSFRYQRQRCEDSDLDCGLDLRARGNRTQALGTAGESLPNSTDSQRHAFRESARFAALEAASFHDDLLEDPNQLILFNF